MIIEFSNAKEPKNHSAMATAIVVTACAFFFIPTTLIILGYYSSQPTGTLISPLPQGVLSEQPTPAPNEAKSEVGPIIASDNPASPASEIAPKAESNTVDKVAVIDPGTSESVIKDPDVTESSLIYLSPRLGDKALYSLKSKKAGEFTISVGTASDTLRYIDYHIVTP